MRKLVNASLNRPPHPQVEHVSAWRIRGLILYLDSTFGQLLRVPLDDFLLTMPACVVHLNDNRTPSTSQRGHRFTVIKQLGIGALETESPMPMGLVTRLKYNIM